MYIVQGKKVNGMIAEVGEGSVQYSSGTLYQIVSDRNREFEG